MDIYPRQKWKRRQALIKGKRARRADASPLGCGGEQKETETR